MVVEVERTYQVDAPCEEVWEALSDPDNRAQSISIVESYEQRGDDYIWQLSLPIPVVRGTMAVKTRDIERDPPRFVRFKGKSKVMHVTGEHELTPVENGCEARSTFIVDGKLPGIETFFERNVDEEIQNILQKATEAISIELV